MRLAALLPVLLVATGLVATPSASGPAAAAPAAAPASAGSIAWSPCTDAWLQGRDLECGSLQVPLDHAHPGGTKIRLALTRRVHTSSAADYRGVMLTNPGGPGGSGLLLPTLGERVPDRVGETYDWIGLDPRGVGSSSPSLHCSWSYFGTDRPSYVPRTRAIRNYWLRKNRSYSAACARTATQRSLIAHMTTLDTVRDMDLLRAALGADLLNLYGFSYGSYLGQVYATRYPDRVGRFVLDGVVDARRTWYDAGLDQDRAFDANLNTFWHYLAKRPRTFRLGSSWTRIRRGYYQKLAQLDRKPSAGGKLGPSELADAMVEVGYYVYGWPEYGRAYAQLIRNNRGGAMFARYRASSMGDDNGFAVYNAVQCTDAPWPATARTLKDSAAVHRTDPFLTWGNTWYNAPCLSWKAPSHARLAVSGSAVSAKILLISETRDAATPYSGALTARRLFPSASLVAGIGGTTHASSLSGVSCVDQTVADYLRTGVVPTRVDGAGPDRACPAVPPPSVSARAARTSGGGDQMPPRLRRALIDAQRHRG